jgi:tetratricopeptide (TPR) repeat protein
METTNTPDLEKTRYLLEENQVFSQSILWDLQKRYFAIKGAEAWRDDDGVPDYITSNPVIANAYAELVFGFWLDRNRLMEGQASREALHLFELGAGPGRFAFHFLYRLMRLCEQTGVPPQSFRYVLTDQAASNLEFWRSHPCFQPFFSNGLLDVATLDMSSPCDVRLQVSGETITRGSLGHPVVIIANYVFDSIPQELLYCNEGVCRRCLMSLFLDQSAESTCDPATLDVSEILPRLQYHYSYETFPLVPYEEEWLQSIIAGYQQTLNDTHLLFPAVGLRCLQWLRGLSHQGLLLIAADKGEHRLEALRGDSPPELVLDDNCFALDVNFHAIKAFCESSGGLTLTSEDYQDDLQVNLCLMVDEPDRYVEARRAYRRHIEDFSPIDFFHIIFHAEQTLGKMSIQEVLAYLRLSCYDSVQLERCLPRLIELAADLGREERTADGIARLFYGMGEYERALTYFSRSIQSHGPNAGSLYNMASCYQMLGQHDLAEPLLGKILEQYPDHEQARKLLEENRQGQTA